MINVIVFDFGGVLVKYDFHTYFAKVLNSREKGEWFMNNILTDENNDKLDKGDRPFSEYIKEWKERWPEYSVAIDAFDKHYTDIFTGEVPGMKELMRSLKSDGYRLLGLSNWSTKVFGVMEKFPEIFSLLDGCLISHQVHMLKPHKEIYDAFCRKFNVSPEDCVFIDDKAVNIEGARAAGMNGIVFTDADKLKAELSSYLNRR